MFTGSRAGQPVTDPPISDKDPIIQSSPHGQNQAPPYICSSSKSKKEEKTIETSMHVDFHMHKMPFLVLGQMMSGYKLRF